MPVPKRKTSKSKRDKRRTHTQLKASHPTACSQCGEAKLPHHVCHSCGFYNGRSVIATEE